MIVTGKRKRQITRIIRNYKGNTHEGTRYIVIKLSENKWRVIDKFEHMSYIVKHGGLSWDVTEDKKSEAIY